VKSSFAVESDRPVRPWPPKNKYEHGVTDVELGLTNGVGIDSPG